MKNKKIIMYLIILVIILLLIFVGYIILKNNKNRNDMIYEYIPEEEITEEQLRTTIATLYFLKKDNLEIVPERIQIDVKELVNNPYQKLMELMLEGPKNEELISIIPDNTKINKLEKNGDVLYIDLSEDFIKEQNIGKVYEKLMINCIVKTMTELTEINKIKILIDGKENERFPDNGVDFKEYFFRE